MLVPQICELAVCAAFINQQALRRIKWMEFVKCLFSDVNNYWNGIVTFLFFWGGQDEYTMKLTMLEWLHERSRDLGRKTSKRQGGVVGHK